MAPQDLTTLPWRDIISGGGLGGVLFVLWLFLKHIKEMRAEETAASERKSNTIEKVSSDFASTVKQVSNDVNQGLAKMQETQTILLADSRDREAKLHETLRAIAKSELNQR